MDNPLRWQQRFTHFERAYQKFIAIIEIGDPDDLSEIEKMALIQAFEFTFELAWKVLKDYLQEVEGYNVGGPRPVLRQAYQSGHIQDGAVWLEALQIRNQTVHTYNDLLMEETVAFIHHAFSPLARNWYNAFKKEAGT